MVSVLNSASKQMCNYTFLNMTKFKILKIYLQASIGGGGRGENSYKERPKFSKIAKFGVKRTEN